MTCEWCHLNSFVLVNSIKLAGETNPTEIPSLSVSPTARWREL